MRSELVTQHRFVVMIVRKRYISPYRKTKYLTIDSGSMKSEKAFAGAIESHENLWKDGTYFLRDDLGRAFARFEIKEGKLIKLYKSSPVTEEPYPLWSFFRKSAA